jgi:hypothetical protein
LVEYVKPEGATWSTAMFPAGIGDETPPLLQPEEITSAEKKLLRASK